MGWDSIGQIGGVEVVEISIPTWVGSSTTVSVPEIADKPHLVTPGDAASSVAWASNQLFFDSPSTGSLRANGTSPSSALSVIVTIFPEKTT